jgi:hypothetical protein
MDGAAMPTRRDGSQRHGVCCSGVLDQLARQRRCRHAAERLAAAVASAYFGLFMAVTLHV